MEKKINIGFTLGDVNGIGPEVLIKALSDHRILNMCTPIIYGSNRILSYYKKLIDAEHFKYASCENAAAANPKLINVINSIADDVLIEPGVDNSTGGKYALISLEAATADLLSGEIDALVTAPINKHNMQQEGFHFNGHTEYFDNKAGNSGSLMMLLNEHMKVALVTHHIPLQDVPSTLSPEYILQKIEMLNKSLIQDFGCNRPVIAVTGLNPHAGDQGLLGKDEQEIIIPAIRMAQDKKILAVGPLAADGLFGSGHYRSYDAVLAMYHDQGLVGFKALSFESGTNFTAGLPFVRTSPDHGTAYDIAGKNIASAGSMLQAIYTAIDIVRTRKNFHEITANPVKKNVIASERG